MALWDLYQQTFYTWKGTQSSRDFIAVLDDSVPNYEQAVFDYFGTNERPAVVKTQLNANTVEWRVKWSPDNKPQTARDLEAAGDYDVVFTAVRRLSPA